MAFVGVLWTVGGSLDFDLFGTRLVVPGYLGFAAVVYATVAGIVAYLAGRPLVPAVAQKNEAEAQFLAELTRLKEKQPAGNGSWRRLADRRGADFSRRKENLCEKIDQENCDSSCCDEATEAFGKKRRSKNSFAGEGL
ncbi:MAG: hypothetical protein CTY36_01770 [Methylocystis sp.]|nr:MAG: hypothetical protein CTY36_01770 [Methylocystis sp.]